MARQRFSDEDEDDDRDDRRRDDDDDYDDRPRRRRDRDDDDYDDRPRSRAKPGLATAAGVLWVIWGALGAILLIFQIYATITPKYHAANVIMFGEQTAGTMRMISIFQTFLVLLGTVLFLLSGIRTLSGGARSIGTFGGLTIAFCAVYFLIGIGLAMYHVSLTEEALGRMGGPRPPSGALSGIGIIGGICGGLLATTVPLLAGIFALACNKRYMKWWGAVKGYGGRRRY